MHIIGFGDSFITPSDLDYAYTNLVAKHFNATADWKGYSGSGAWDAFFQMKQLNEHPDVVVFAWSNSSRLYHPEVRNICGTAAQQHINSTDPIWQAAYMYYQHLYDFNKSCYEHEAFYYWVDDWFRDNYPNTKIIHMWGFPAVAYGGNYNWGESDQFNYYHRFKNGTEIRPALINLSYRDGWPGDLSKENRLNHMTPDMHRVLADHLIDAIEHYEEGRLVNIT